MTQDARHKGWAITLLVLAAALFATTLLTAFTIFGEVAGLLALGCLASAILLLARH